MSSLATQGATHEQQSASTRTSGSLAAAEAIQRAEVLLRTRQGRDIRARISAVTVFTSAWCVSRAQVPRGPRVGRLLGAAHEGAHA